MALSFIPHKPKRIIALGFIVFGIILASPPLTPLTAWSEIVLDIPIANFITAKTGISFFYSLFLTYTLIPILLVYTGAFLYPHSTNSILHGILSRIKNGIHRYFSLVRRNPVHLIWLALSFFILYWYYNNYIVI